MKSLNKITGNLHKMQKTPTMPKKPQSSCRCTKAQKQKENCSKFATMENFNNKTQLHSQSWIFKVRGD